MELVSANTEAEIERRRAAEDFEHMARRLAGNLLRVVRGAGQPYAVFEAVNGFVLVAERYRAAHGCYPPSHTIAEWLSIDDPFIAEWRAKPDKSERQLAEEWRLEADERIIRGALQVAASRLLDDKLRVHAGQKEMLEGIQQREEANAMFRKSFATEMQRAPRKRVPKRPKPLGDVGSR